MNATFPATPLPGAAQRQLLRAALLSGDAALEAWARWQASCSVDTLDAESQWLLPLLYCNLQSNGVDEQRLLRYAAVYRHNFYKNALLLQALIDALRSSRLAGGDVIVINAAALALRYYPRQGARPIRVLDVVLPDAGLRPLADALRLRGWRSLDGRCFTDALRRCITLHDGWAGFRYAELAVQCAVEHVHGQLLLAPRPEVLWSQLASDSEWPDGLLLWIADTYRLTLACQHEHDHCHHGPGRV